MVPVPMRHIFRNRWWALVWAGGIIWSAVQFAGTPPADDDGAAGNDALAAVANAIG